MKQKAQIRTSIKGQTESQWQKWVPSSSPSHTSYRLHRNAQARPCSIEILTSRTTSSSVQVCISTSSISSKSPWSKSFKILKFISLFGGGRDPDTCKITTTMFTYQEGSHEESQIFDFQTYRHCKIVPLNMPWQFKGSAYLHEKFQPNTLIQSLWSIQWSIPCFVEMDCGLDSKISHNVENEKTIENFFFFSPFHIEHELRAEDLKDEERIKIWNLHKADIYYSRYGILKFSYKKRFNKGTTFYSWTRCTYGHKSVKSMFS